MSSSCRTSTPRTFCIRFVFAAVGAERGAPCDHGRMRPEDRGGAMAHSPARLGAGDGPIEIVEYDPSWPACYDAERERLARLLPDLRIHHIGSSAVPGL